jgi:hypothetical protein
VDAPPTLVDFPLAIEHTCPLIEQNEDGLAIMMWAVGWM